MIIGSPKSDREWVYLLFVCSLIELIFLHVVYTYGHEEEVKRSWDFAAVLISIILAVIAILYGMYQSITQESNVQKLASQIESLQSLLSDVKGSREEFKTDLEGMKAATATLEEIAAGVRSHDKHLLEARDQILEGLGKQSQSHGIATSAKPEELLHPERFPKFLHELNLGPTVVLYLLQKFRGAYSDKELLEKVVFPALEEGKEDDWTGGLWEGLLAGVKSSVVSMGAGTFTASGSVRLRDEYQAATEKYFQETPQNFSTDWYKKVVVAADKLAQHGGNS